MSANTTTNTTKKTRPTKKAFAECVVRFLADHTAPEFREEWTEADGKRWIIKKSVFDDGFVEVFAKSDRNLVPEHCGFFYLHAQNGGKGQGIKKVGDWDAQVFV